MSEEVRWRFLLRHTPQGKEWIWQHIGSDGRVRKSGSGCTTFTDAIAAAQVHGYRPGTDIFMVAPWDRNADPPPGAGASNDPFPCRPDRST